MIQIGNTYKQYDILSCSVPISVIVSYAHRYSEYTSLTNVVMSKSRHIPPAFIRLYDLMNEFDVVNSKLRPTKEQMSKARSIVMEECVPHISDITDSNITAFVGGYGVFSYIKDSFTCQTNISFLGKQNRELYNDYLLTLAPSIIIPISVSFCHNKSEMSLLCNGSTSVFDGAIYDCYEIKENRCEYRCDTLAFSSTEFNVISEITVRRIMIDIYCTVCEMLRDRVCPEAIYTFDRDYDVSDLVGSITFDYTATAVQHIKTREAEFSKLLNC